MFGTQLPAPQQRQNGPGAMKATQSRLLSPEACMDEILFSADPRTVEAAIEHLVDHGELYWSLAVPIKRKPTNGYIHIKGSDQVTHRAVIARILPFDPTHVENPAVKPDSWRKASKAKRWKTTFVITRIEPFLRKATSFKKSIDGESVRGGQQNCVYVLTPDE